MRRSSALLVLIGCLLLLASGPKDRWVPRTAEAAGEVTAVPADFRQDPLYYYYDLRPGEARRYAATVLADPATTPPLRKAVLTTLATIAIQENRPSEARAVFSQILRLEPTANLDHPEKLPPPVTRLFYRMRDSLCASRQDELVSQGQLVTELRTIAVWDIENNSFAPSKWNLDHLCRGLGQAIITDLQGATELKIVERQRLNVLRDDLELGKNPGQVDPKYRVQMGRLCGAQSYLFGQFMLVSKNRVRMDLRWVRTDTGEILLAKGVEQDLGGPDGVFQLERKVLLDLLAPQIRKMLAGELKPGQLEQRFELQLEQRRKSLDKRSSYTAMIESSGSAMALEDGGDYAGAAAAWERVASMSPADSTARFRARALNPLRRSGRG